MEWLLPYFWAFASGTWPDSLASHDRTGWSDHDAGDSPGAGLSRLDLDLVPVVYPVLLEGIEGVTFDRPPGPQINVTFRLRSAGAATVVITTHGHGRTRHWYTAQVQRSDGDLWFGQPQATRVPIATRLRIFLASLSGRIRHRPDAVR
jgi:hypothetical protein